MFHIFLLHLAAHGSQEVKYLLDLLVFSQKTYGMASSYQGASLLGLSGVWEGGHRRNQAHPAPTEQHRSPARSLAALHRSPASRTASEHPLQDANSRTDIENGRPANHLRNKTWQPRGTPEEQPHVVVVLGLNTDSFAISKSIKKGNKGPKMNIYESFLLLW